MEWDPSKIAVTLNFGLHCARLWIALICGFELHWFKCEPLGIQVPAGTVEPGEEPDAAVLREAWEETGLAGLKLAGFLGERLYVHYSLPEVHQRYFYHLVCEGDPPDAWQHWERNASDGSADHLFEFFWALLPVGVPEMVADHDALLPELQRAMEL
jgi:8-oxo-dGTP diphosphatase